MYNKKQKSRIFHRDNVTNIMKLEINKLGRPYHKVPKIFTDRFDILDAQFSTYFLKKYRVNVALKELNFSMDCVHKHALIFSTALGNVGFDIDRPLLLNILNDYYGLSKENQPTAAHHEAPVTKTEERLRSKLGTEIVNFILDEAIFGHNLEVKNDYSTLINKWSYKVTFSLEGYNEGYIHFLLDTYHVDKLLAILRNPNNADKKDNSVLLEETLDHFMQHLPIRLTGQLSTTNMTIAQLMTLKVGDVIPISLPDRFMIQIGQEQPFTAIIAEDRGKLFFSEFQDKMNDTHPINETFHD